MTFFFFIMGGWLVPFCNAPNAGEQDCGCRVVVEYVEGSDALVEGFLAVDSLE